MITHLMGMAPYIAEKVMSKYVLDETQHGSVLVICAGGRERAAVRRCFLNEVERHPELATVRAVEAHGLFINDVAVWIVTAGQALVGHRFNMIVLHSMPKEGLTEAAEWLRTVVPTKQDVDKWKL